jgi:hypothetical protein
MAPEILRCSGITSVGDLPWGAHFCYWYRGRADLLGLLMPFFATGLLDNEQCLWVTSEPLTAQDAGDQLLARSPQLRTHLTSGQIGIVDHSAWRQTQGDLGAAEMYDFWIDAEQTALSRGYAGLRVGGNTGFLHTPDDWQQFERYESGLTRAMAGHRFIGLCCYDIARTVGSHAEDVARNHHFCVSSA